MLKLRLNFGIERTWFGAVRSNILTFLGVLLATFVFSQAAGAVEIHGEGSACDAHIWNTHTQRAWMSGKQEMEVAQTLILKPDSVLEYSCFPQRRAELASERTRWTGRRLEDGWAEGAVGAIVQEAMGAILDFLADVTDSDIIGAIGDILEAEMGDNFPMEDPLNVLVLDPMSNYAAGNFYHTLGGGTYDDALASGALCDGMAAIWDFLKCSNFDENSFVTFGTLAANDIRTLPRACPANELEYPQDSYNTTSRADKWETAIEEAFPPPEFDHEAYSELGAMDAMFLRYDRVDSNECAALRPIPTGLLVQTAPPGEYDPETETRAGWYPDMICPGAGCRYVPYRLGGAGGSGGECAP